MVANPMQKRARNSFLLGVLITLIICLILFALFYFLVINKNENGEKGEEVVAYVLNQDVKSGDAITTSMLDQIKVYTTMLPENYIDSSVLSSMQSQSDGESIIAKVDLYKNTILTSELVNTSDTKITNDVRYVEYNMLVLPTTLAVGDYIDIRLTLPNGQDLIVISKKEVKSILGDTIGLELTEGDILMMESAIVEAYIMTSSKLYAIQYVEPGNQTAAIKTYTPTDAVEKLIAANSNITNEAKTALANQFIGGERTYIENERNNYASDAQSNLETGIQQEIENAKAAREAYLSGLTSY